MAGERCPWCGDDPLYIAYHDDENRPIATSASTFMIGTKGKSAIGDAMAEQGVAKK